MKTHSVSGHAEPIKTQNKSGKHQIEYDLFPQGADTLEKIVSFNKQLRQFKKVHERFAHLHTSDLNVNAIIMLHFDIFSAT